MKAETKSETVSKSVKYRDISLDMHQPRRTMKGVTKSAVYALASGNMEQDWGRDEEKDGWKTIAERTNLDG